MGEKRKWLRWESAGEGLVLLILLLAAVVFGWILWRWPEALEKDKQEGTGVEVREETVTTLPVVTGKEEGIVAGEWMTRQTPVAQIAELVIEYEQAGGRYSVPVGEGMTVAAVMQKAQAQGLKLNTKDFGGTLGVFVEGINGVRGESAAGYYWVFAINGEKPPVGISSARVKAGDTITWTYEKGE